MADTHRFAIAIVGGVEGGQFSLCSGEWCTGPIEWDATAEDIALSLRGLGVNVVSASGGPLPEQQIEIELEATELSADAVHALSGDAYFGGAGIAVVVAELE